MPFKPRYVRSLSVRWETGDRLRLTYLLTYFNASAIWGQEHNNRTMSRRYQQWQSLLHHSKTREFFTVSYCYWVQGSTVFNSAWCGLMSTRSTCRQTVQLWCACLLRRFFNWSAICTRYSSLNRRQRLGAAAAASERDRFPALNVSNVFY